MYLENLNKTATPFPQSYLTRFSLPIHHGQVTTECIAKNIELPRINYRYNMKDYRYVYGVGGDNKQIFNHLIKVDIKKKVQKIWKKQHCFPGEPVFVARAKAKTEDDGVVLSVVLNEQNQQSFLLVLDAQSFKEQAIASLPSPFLVCMGFLLLHDLLKKYKFLFGINKIIRCLDRSNPEKDQK